MKILFSSSNSAEVGLLHSRLESEGIACEIRNEYLSPAMPGAPFDPELWVIKDEELPKRVSCLHCGSSQIHQRNEEAHNLRWPTHNHSPLFFFLFFCLEDSADGLFGAGIGALIFFCQSFNFSCNSWALSGNFAERLFFSPRSSCRL